MVPLYMGKDTHAVSDPAQRTALEVLAANGVDTMIQRDNGVTPTPVISRAILVYNRDRKDAPRRWHCHYALAQSARGRRLQVQSDERRPCRYGCDRWVQDRANELLRGDNAGVKRVPFAAAMKAASTHQEDFVLPYVHDLRNVVDMDAIRAAGLKLGVDPLGGASLPLLGADQRHLSTGYHGRQSGRSTQRSRL